MPTLRTQLDCLPAVLMRRRPPTSSAPSLILPSLKCHIGDHTGGKKVAARGTSLSCRQAKKNVARQYGKYSHSFMQVIRNYAAQKWAM